ncbi:MAG: class I SAM-dependent methyltransferase [Planctomycetota bacterium]|jgi:ubiquinone/menaquinone biosynthesis C-methylase UbiE
MNGEFDPVAELYARYPYPPAEPSGRAWRRKYRTQVGEGESIAHALVEMNPALEGGLILDAGCGTGLKLLGLSKTLPGATVVGADVSQASLAIARKLVQDAGFTNIRLSWASLSEGFPADRDGTFDAVVCDGVLHHLKSPEMGLQNLVRTLKPGGLGWITLFGKHGRAEMGRLRQMVTILEPRFLHFERRLGVARSLLRAMGKYSRRMAKRFDDDSFLADAALNPRESWYDLVTARRFLEDAGLVLESWVDGEKYWEELTKALGRAGLEMGEYDKALSGFDRMRMVELWKCPGMLRFIVRKAT